ncbi:MAG: hypothetical protein JOZ18_15830 [Chloroflexi bacterium]|nr:hypothetical protein [Chloroflexota bacterium]
MNPDNENTTNTLPAILIGAPRNSGKSILTYNLSQALRQFQPPDDIPHYVFRANTDGEGDWLFEASPEEVRQLRIKGEWTDEFRELVRRDIARRLVPIIVDIGGLPGEKDHGIFSACTHSILLIKDDAKDTIQTWRNFITAHGLTPLAEIRSQLSGPSVITSQENDPVITGSITFGQERQERIYGIAFDALVKCVTALFRSYPPDELERLHRKTEPEGFEIVRLHQHLNELLPTAREWSTNLLEPLCSKLSPQAQLAVYGRGPVWLYGALALYSKNEPFRQFDPRYGWIEPPHIRSGSPVAGSETVVTLEPRPSGSKYMILVRPKIPEHYYLDYERDAGQLVFPDPPSECGIIVSGRLPLWLFTALARFYAQKNAPWIALHDASMNRAIVVYSRVAGYTIGKRVPLPG